MKLGTPGRAGLEDRTGPGVGWTEENGEQAGLHLADSAALRKRPQHSHARKGGQAWPHRTKLVNNSLAISSMAATSEAIACGLRGGLEMVTMPGVIDASSGQSFVSSRMFPACMASGCFDSGGVATLLEKDVSAFVDAASDLGAAHTVAAATPRTVSAFAALAPEADQTRVYACIRDAA